MWEFFCFVFCKCFGSPAAFRRKRGNWVEERQQLAQIPASLLSLPDVFSLFSRLVTRTWSFQPKGEPNTHAFISFFFSVSPPYFSSFSLWYTETLPSPVWCHIKKKTTAGEQERWVRGSERRLVGGGCYPLRRGDGGGPREGQGRGETAGTRMETVGSPGQRGWTLVNLGRAEWSSRSLVWRTGRGLCTSSSLAVSGITVSFMKDPSSSWKVQEAEPTAWTSLSCELMTLYGYSCLYCSCSLICHFYLLTGMQPNHNLKLKTRQIKVVW